ncbi:MAG TPA: hypothetical protein PK752_14790, partial [Accumulibacter sp.]|uniref:hypothetical protein n=1 Tax=Accumulibacter sp. TaxID=2053492 RepID=UPI002BAA78DD
ALEVFSQSFAKRLPSGVKLAKNSAKYHLLDVWDHYGKRGMSQNVALDVPQEDPILDLLRKDAQWLLRRSGLGVLAAGGNAADAKVAGLGLSGDGLRERARAFAGLMMVAMPFLPGDASLTLLAEGRTEAAIADAARYNLFSETATDNRLFEPYRNFIGHLREDLVRASERCRSVVADNHVVSEFSCKGSMGRDGLMTFLETLSGIPFLRAHAAEAVAAMKGIADLAAALMPRPAGGRYRMVVPPDFSANHWAGNFRELRHAIYG